MSSNIENPDASAVHELMLRHVDGEATEAEAAKLTHALESDPSLRWEFAHLLMQCVQLAELGKQMATETAGSDVRHPRRFPYRWLSAASVAAGVILAVSAGWALLSRPTYPEPVAEGRVQITREGVALPRNSSARRGDRIRAETDGVWLTLGGYCRLNLAAGTRVSLAGQPGDEVIRLARGGVHSRVDSAAGRFKIETDYGDLVVQGTEFLAELTLLPALSGVGAMEASSQKLSKLLSVVVMSGVVVCHLGEEVVALGSGQSYLYAGERIPPELKGFQGMMSGKLTKKGETMIAFKVGKIMKKWKGNRAENPGAAVGKTIILTLEKVTAHHAERILKNYRGLKVGEDIELEAFDVGGEFLAVNEWLKKVVAEGD